MKVRTYFELLKCSRPQLQTNEGYSCCWTLTNKNLKTLPQECKSHVILLRWSMINNPIYFLPRPNLLLLDLRPTGQMIRKKKERFTKKKLPTLKLWLKTGMTSRNPLKMVRQIFFSRCTLQLFTNFFFTRFHHRACLQGIWGCSICQV